MSSAESMGATTSTPRGLPDLFATPFAARQGRRSAASSRGMHWTFVWIGYLVTCATIPHILLRNKPPASTLAWVWAAILFPYGGAIFYFVFGTDRLVRQSCARPARWTLPAAGPSADFDSSHRIVAEEFVQRSRGQRWNESLVGPLAPLI